MVWFSSQSGFMMIVTDFTTPSQMALMDTSNCTLLLLLLLFVVVEMLETGIVEVHTLVSVVVHTLTLASVVHWLLWLVMIVVVVRIVSFFWLCYTFCCNFHRNNIVSIIVSICSNYFIIIVIINNTIIMIIIIHLKTFSFFKLVLIWHRFITAQADKNGMKWTI